MLLRLHILSFLLYSVFKVPPAAGHFAASVHHCTLLRYFPCTGSFEVSPACGGALFRVLCTSRSVSAFCLSQVVALPVLSFRLIGRSLCVAALFFPLITSYNVREMPPVQPVVGSSGLEPPTSRLSGVRSNHLSYEPMSVAVCDPAIPAYLCVATLAAQPVVEMNRIELSTPCLQGRCSPS